MAVEHAENYPERSIGIVTVNVKQTELVNAEIERLLEERPAFAEWRQAREGTLHRFFVKNLENVQGDERDTIFISTVYGPVTPNGPVAQRFGPINNDGGERRLNVLFTRAKSQIIIVTSLRPEDIRTTENSKPGVVALKNYLTYARDGYIPDTRETGREPDSDFEQNVRAVIQAHGYDAVPQVGTAGFYIDLAVRHPDRSGEYILGVECDGATYHSSANARDRDRLRQEILENLGWRLYRIWSLDWFRYPQREQQKLLDAIKQAKIISDAKHAS